MSILIKGIDMPKDCDECPMRQINLAYCQLMHESTSHYLSGKEIQGRPNFCPLVEIPTPHGRLIDSNKLEAMMYHEAFETDSDMQKWDSGCWIRYKDFENCMNRLLPDTIIGPEE